MKRVVIATLMALAATATHANAGKFFKEEKPCWSKCAAVAASPSGPFVHQELSDPDLTYQSRSQSVYTSAYGTSTLNSTYKVYRK